MLVVIAVNDKFCMKLWSCLILLLLDVFQLILNLLSSLYFSVTDMALCHRCLHYQIKYIDILQSWGENQFLNLSHKKIAILTQINFTST